MNSAAAVTQVAPYQPLIVAGPGNGGGAEVRVLNANTGALEADRTGVVWKLPVEVRDLDSNVIALPPDGRIDTHFCEPIGHVQVSGDYVESWQPHPMHPAALEKARQIAKAVTDDLGIGLDGQSTGLGLFGVELFVKGDQVWFSEVSPRPHDTGMVTMATQWQNEFELHARAILGLPVNTALRSPGASAVIYGGVDATGIAFGGVDEALRVPNTDIRLFGKPESFKKRRMGVALAFDADVEVARTNAKLAASKVRPRVA